MTDFDNPSIPRSELLGIVRESAVTARLADDVADDILQAVAKAPRVVAGVMFHHGQRCGCPVTQAGLYDPVAGEWKDSRALRPHSADRAIANIHISQFMSSFDATMAAYQGLAYGESDLGKGGTVFEVVD